MDPKTLKLAITPTGVDAGERRKSDGRERQVFLPLCDKFFLGRVIIDLGTIIMPNTVRQLKFLKTGLRQVVWSMSRVRPGLLNLTRDTSS